MSDSNAPALGVIGSAELGAAMGACGFRIVSANGFEACAREVQTELAVTPTMPIIADLSFADEPAFDIFLEGVATRTRVVILGSKPQHELARPGAIDGAVTMALPATTSEVMLAVGYQAADIPQAKVVIEPEAGSAPASSPVPVPVPARVSPSNSADETTNRPASVAAAPSVLLEPNTGSVSVTGEPSVAELVARHAAAAEALHAAMAAPNPDLTLIPRLRSAEGAALDAVMAAQLEADERRSRAERTAPAPTHPPMLESAPEPSAAPAPVVPAPIDTGMSPELLAILAANQKSTPSPAPAPVPAPVATLPASAPQPAPIPDPAPIAPQQSYGQPAPVPVPQKHGAGTAPNAAPAPSLFANPMQAAPTGPKRGVLVIATSGSGGVGKTSSSIDLANMGARAGLKVVVIDSDHGQSDLHKRLRIPEGVVPTIYDAVTSGSPAAAIVTPNQYNPYRQSAVSDPLGFACVFGAPNEFAESTPAYVYGQVIDYARTIADLVIVDTEILKASPSPQFTDVLIPRLRDDAWLLAVYGPAATSTENIFDRLGELVVRDGVPRSRVMVMARNIAALPAAAREQVEQRIGSNGRFVGAALHDETYFEQMNLGSFKTELPAVGPTIRAVLYAVTGSQAFAPQPVDPRARKSRGLRGWIKK